MKNIPLPLKMLLFIPIIGILPIILLKDTIKSDNTWCSDVGTLNYKFLFVYQIWVLAVLFVYVNTIL